jgi:PhnB protein
MPTLHAYLGFDGNCADAMRFYAQTFGAEIRTLIRNGESPMAGEIPKSAHDRVMHAHLVGPGFELMAGDAPEGQPARMQGCMLTLGYDKAADAKRIFEVLAAGGQVTMPPGETFWADFFGLCVDRFGTAWGVNGGPKPLG